jgi:hypothetical protein
VSVLSGMVQALMGMLLERGLVAMVSKAGARGSYSSITITPQVCLINLPRAPMITCIGGHDVLLMSGVAPTSRHQQWSMPL